jgi:CRP-like cAMP-binding protein
MQSLEQLGGFFGVLEPLLRKQLADRVHPARVRKWQTVIEHGSRSHDVYFLVEGELRVLLFSADGREVSVRTLAPRNLFGEVAAIDGLPRCASVVATVPSLVLVMSREDFLHCIRNSPGASLWLAQQFAAQIRTLTEKIFELSTLNVRNRLHCELLRLALTAGVDANMATIKPAPTHAELANRIGTHREAVTRELRDLAGRKILRQDRRQLDIVDIGQLSRIVQRLGGQSLGIHAAPPKSANGAEAVRLTAQHG